MNFTELTLPWCDVKVAQHTVERPIQEITRNE